LRSFCVQRRVSTESRALDRDSLQAMGESRNRAVRGTARLHELPYRGELGGRCPAAAGNLLVEAVRPADGGCDAERPRDRCAGSGHRARRSRWRRVRSSATVSY
jgi:hypothetical protein